MPSYLYRCPNGHELSTFESITAPATRLCPECHQPKYDRHFEECNCSDHEAPEYVYMTRVIQGGGGVLWKQGAPTPKFSGRRR